ncbi:hypothetical protein [Cohnella luojiensis]|uniref:Uncharacterized protein n=1 Tax=Cohnella luojiensis TaxID=652876 RepID=A0A4Y8M3V4_9BACL|nr:hypothetical protein [Cohnella luojiensis]TFE29450.1 hypothetical protein E2980_05490 [Cohnella luojiensis]
MRMNYSRIAWGLGLELIDFRIGGFDLLPDVLGYFLIMLGLSRMTPGHRCFQLARGAAGVLLVGSVLQLLGIQAGFSLTSNETPNIDVLALTGIIIAAELVMVFGICGGIRASALGKGKWALAKSARDGWYIIFVLGTVISLLLPFQLNRTTSEGIGVAFILTAVFFIANLWVIFLVRRAGRELPGRRSGGGPDGNLGGTIDITG